MKLTLATLELLRDALKLAVIELDRQRTACGTGPAHAAKLYALDSQIGQFDSLAIDFGRAIAAKRRAQEVAGRPLAPSQYLGKICPVHPELNGLRAKPGYRCVQCVAEYVSNFRKRKRSEKK